MSKHQHHWHHAPSIEAMAWPPAPPCYPDGCQPHCICVQIAERVERARAKQVRKEKRHRAR